MKEIPTTENGVISTVWKRSGLNGKSYRKNLEWLLHEMKGDGQDVSQFDSKAILEKVVHYSEKKSEPEISLRGIYSSPYRKLDL